MRVQSYIDTARRRIADEEVLDARLVETEAAGTVLMVVTRTGVRAFVAKVRRLRGLKLGDELAVSEDLLELIGVDPLPAPA